MHPRRASAASTRRAAITGRHVYRSPDRLRSFRIANRTAALCELSDRFHVTPLLRTITFPQAAYGLALPPRRASTPPRDAVHRFVHSYPYRTAETIRTIRRQRRTANRPTISQATAPVAAILRYPV